MRFISRLWRHRTAEELKTWSYFFGYCRIILSERGGALTEGARKR
ncbi:nicotinate-nucleotide pyrophosphorylase [Nitrobacter sp. Nb-311A]|nr:nicotinate-nucleotide pyrophosphorylase [Nitrobacter sp. Nb-311A]